MIKTFHGTVNKDGIETKIKTLKGIILDVDGVLTDNRVLEGVQDAKPKWRSYYDGQGISLLRSIGLKICFVTNEKGVSAQSIIDLVDHWNNLPSVERKTNPNGWSRIDLFLGVNGLGKTKAVEEWMQNHFLEWNNCAAMVDDLVDFELMNKVSVVVAPVSAEKVILDSAHFISRRPAGMGAIRDFANFILDVKGIDQVTLPTE